MRISLIVILISCLFCISCSKSKEEKIQELVDTAIKNCLYYPDSYDPIELSTDSVFNEMFSADCLEAATLIIKLNDEIVELNNALEQEMGLLDNYTSSYYPSLFESDIRRSKSNIQKMENSRLEKENQLLQLFNALQDQYWQQKEFTGYCAIQKFRCKYNDNNTYIDQFVLYIDAEATQCLFSYDINDKAITSYFKIIELIQRIGEDNYKQEAWKQIFPHRATDLAK